LLTPRRWEEFHTGTLYLSAFSGPVEGILMICVIYLINALHPQGIAFWDTPVSQLIPGEIVSSAAGWADDILGLKGSMSLAGLPVNVAFMLVGAFGTVGNIFNRSPIHLVSRAMLMGGGAAIGTSSSPVGKRGNHCSSRSSAIYHS